MKVDKRDVVVKHKNRDLMLYQGIVNMVVVNERLETTKVERRFVLLTSFYDLLWFILQAYQDAIKIVRVKDIFDGFIIFICNLGWDKITIEFLLR
uniref:Uncharacterized protein n=2 Tax=Physcomitrium patens TaxID=3218 RepID=A0A2K1JDB8_PHYPA|nr:hypothetical protein PHYPA_019805 [Physcomitrium patens]